MPLLTLWAFVACYKVNFTFTLYASRNWGKPQALKFRTVGVQAKIRVQGLQILVSSILNTTARMLTESTFN